MSPRVVRRVIRRVDRPSDHSGMLSLEAVLVLPVLALLVLALAIWSRSACRACVGSGR